MVRCAVLAGRPWGAASRGAAPTLAARRPGTAAGAKAVCGPVAASPRAARRAWRASPLYANWLACPAPSLAAWGRCGWVARWVCGLRRGGSAPPVRGPPGGRGLGSPHQRTGPVGPPAGWLRAALRGWAALACLRASPAPFLPSQLAGPPAEPAAGWAASPVPVAAPWPARGCVPAAAPPRPPPWRGAARHSRAMGRNAPHAIRGVPPLRRRGFRPLRRAAYSNPRLYLYEKMGQHPPPHTRHRLNKMTIYFVES